MVPDPRPSATTRLDQACGPMDPWPEPSTREHVPGPCPAPPPSRRALCVSAHVLFRRPLLSPRGSPRAAARLSTPIWRPPQRPSAPLCSPQLAPATLGAPRVPHCPPRRQLPPWHSEAATAEKLAHNASTNPPHKRT